MIETRVRVLSHSRGISLVEATQENGCGACASQGQCGLSGLGRYFSRRRPPIALACGAVQSGQELTVAVSESDLLQAGLWAYLLPSGLALAGAALMAPLGDPAAVAGAALGVATGLGLARRLARSPRISIVSGETP